MVTLFTILLVCLLVVPSQAQTTVEIVASRDNTLIENTGAVRSNGAGNSIFAGRVASPGNETRRRALLFFDLVANIPPGAQVTEVALRLQVTQTRASSSGTFTLHQVLQDWGEGTSSSTGGNGGAATTNDATWLHTFFPSQQWSQPGGDFVETASATHSVGNLGSYTWASTDQLVADVQNWIADPSSNRGWLLKGPEDNSQTVRKFASRENNTAAHRPTLVVTYQMPVVEEVRGDVSGDRQLAENDAVLLLQHLVGLITLDTNQQQRAEVSGNAALSVVDASLILARVAGLRDCFPVESGCPSGAAFKQEGWLPTFAWGTPVYEEEGRVQVPIGVSEPIGALTAVMLKIPLDNIHVEEIKLATEGWAQAVHIEHNTLFIALAGATKLAASSLATITFRQAEVTEPTQLRATVQIAEHDPQAVAEQVLFEQPEAVVLAQSYPNPFAEATTIEVEMSHAAHVSLHIYDLQGREVAQVMNGYVDAGRHPFAWNASGQPSGMYVYRLEVGQQVLTKPLVLVR